MSVMERLPSSPPALSEKELEVLRLLAAGHTVKSIAASLGRTEASINERLRDARRKTGVGSSRELARQLAAQKNWDRNFDLAEPILVPDGVPQPSARGRVLPKGTLVMLATLPLSAAIALALAAPDAPQQVAPPPQPAAAAATKDSPLAGRWSLDVSRIPEAERPQRVTIEFRTGGDQKWATRVEIVAPDGSVMQAVSTAAPDGVAVPVTGTMPFIDSVSLRQPAPNTLVMTLGKGGAPVSTRVYTVAKDRQSMTETIVWASSGLPKLETTYFRRID